MCSHQLLEYSVQLFSSYIKSWLSHRKLYQCDWEHWCGLNPLRDKRLKLCMDTSACFLWWNFFCGVWVKKQHSSWIMVSWGKPSMKPRSFPFVLCHWFSVVVSSAAGWFHSLHDVNMMQKNIYSFSCSCFDRVLMLFLWSTLRDNHVHLLDLRISSWSLSC